VYEIAIINPRTLGKKRRARKAGKSGAKSMAKRKKRKMTAKQLKYFGKRKRRTHKVKAKSVRRRRRSASTAKRRPAMGYVQGSGRIRRKKLNPRRRHRGARRYSNPRFSLSGITSQLVPAAYGAGGALALDLALGYIPLPDMLKTGYARHGVRIVGALGIGWLASKFLRGRAQAIGAGALTVAMYGLFKDVALQFAPAAISSKLGEYEEITVEGYDDPASIEQGTAGFGAYLGNATADDDLGGVGAYMEGVGGADY
jgi:hypothetical protein